MERSERDRPEQTDAGRTLDQVTLPPPPSQEQRDRTFAEAAADVQSDNEQRPRRNLDPSEEAEEREHDKWDDAEKTNEHIDRLKTQGHGPQRHVEITDEGIDGRLGTAAHDQNGVVVLRNDGHVRKARGSQLDPETGTSRDAETGGLHYCGPYATRFNDPADYCRADEILRDRARTTGEMRQVAPVDSLFSGRDANELFSGRYQDPKDPESADGSPNFTSIDFRDGTVMARYVLGQNGDLDLRTMFVEPDRSRNP